MLDSASIKLLLILMSRTYQPMEFTVAYIVPINFDTFVKVSIGLRNGLESPFVYLEFS